MAATKANWHLPALPVDEGDPLAAPDPIERHGTPISLSDQEARLNTQLLELLRAEGDLFDAGLRCEIKDRSDTCCHACPLQNRGELCDLGRQQEDVCTRMAIANRDRTAQG